jgi:hypothetical protein
MDLVKKKLTTRWKDYEKKYLKYKNKYLFLKKQIGGQRTVNIYDKANYRNLLFTIDLDDDDDIDILKYEIMRKINDKGDHHIGSIEEINIFQHDGFCIEPKLNGINDTMNNFCMSIEKLRKFSPIPMRSGLMPSLGKKEFSNLSSPEYYGSRSIVENDVGEFDGLVTKGYYLDDDSHIDLEEGRGTYRSLRRDLAIRISLDGHFLNNKLVNGTKRLYQDDIHKEYIGTFVNNNLVNGKITIYDIDGNIFEIHNGRFDDLENIIEGSITRENDQIERGTFTNNLLQGQGSIQYPDGRVVSGNYSKGVLKK